MLDRGIGEQPFDVAAAVQHEGGEDERGQAHRHHERPRGNGGGVGGDQDLETQHGIEGDIEQEARQHRRDRRRPFGMRVGKPRVERRETDLGAVAEDQKDEGDIEERRVEGGGALDQERPSHGVETFADDRLGGHVDQNGPEQSKGDADAAEDEIFPRRLERFGGAIEADHEHGGQRRQFDRDPHQADIVGDEGEVHAEHHDLIHGMIETQVRRRQPTGIELAGDIARAEDAGREADESVEHDEDDVEVVDQQVLAGFRPLDHEQRQRRRQGQKTGDDIQARRQAIAWE
jgi:hypothetical protein